MGKYKAVFFDFAGTLFDDRLLKPHMVSNLRWISKNLRMIESDGPSENDLVQAYKAGIRDAFIQFMPQPYYLHSDFFACAYREAFATLGLVLDDALAYAAVEKQYDYTAKELRLRDDCNATLKHLSASGLHLQIVSNFDQKPLLSALEQHNLLDLFDAYTSSEEALSCKPQTEIFNFALNKANCKPAEVIFVGDSPMQDIAGANAAGLYSVLLDPADRHANLSNPGQRPAARIPGLSDVISLAVQT